MDTSIPLKQCPTCKEWKPRTPEFFARNKARRDGLYSYCRPCWKARYQPHPRTWEDLPEGFRRCTKCKVVSPETTTYFRPLKAYRGGLNSECRDCYRAYRRKYPDKPRHKSPEGYKRCPRCQRDLPATS